MTAALAAERAAADTALRFPVGDTDVMVAREQAQRAAEALSSAERASSRAAGALTGLQRAEQAVRIQVDEHERSRPGGLLGRLGIGQATAAWQQRRDELAAQLAHRAGQVRDAQRQADQLAANVTAAHQRARGTARDVEALISRRADGEQRVRRAREAWGPVFPDNWLQLTRTSRNSPRPGRTRNGSTARTRVFLAALDLHRAFVAGAAGTIRRNLRQLIATLAREPGAPPPNAELVAWQTLFLLLPVVSTTFASCGRMFAALGADSLGWVLVDEAGQAVPQHAAGALWRARRAVIVGDPLQLEPIFQVPGQVQDRLRDLFGVAGRWLPAGTSAQGMADRHNRWGTEIPVENRNGDTEKIWVGEPAPGTPPLRAAHVRDQQHHRLPGPHGLRDHRQAIPRRPASQLPAQQLGGRDRSRRRQMGRVPRATPCFASCGGCAMATRSASTASTC